LVFRVRQLAREEWSLLRDLRLAALVDAPDQFGETSLMALQRSVEEWTALTSSDTSGSASDTHIAEVDGAAVGMAFAIQDRTDAATGRIGGMWVAPDARGHGIGMALVRAVIDWSRSRGMQRVRLWVVPSTAADELYRRAQFIPTGAQKLFPGDDSRSVIEMQLKLGDAT
jgi:GNAT superfamily N-acetyltransferase